MQNSKMCAASGCPLMLSRRGFLTSVAVSAVAAKTGLLDFASSLFAAPPKPPGKPLVRAVFVRPKVERYWMGWPGAAYNIKGHQRQYTDVLTAAARKLGINLEVINEPIHNSSMVNAFLERLKKDPPDGLVITSMCLHQGNVHWWGYINDLAKNRGKIPTIIFSPMGTSFTNDLQENRNIPGVFVAATHDINWLAFGLRMLNAIWQMKHTRICILDSRKSTWGITRKKPLETEDIQLDVVGTTLHFVPINRFAEEFKKAKTTDEMRAIADYYTKNAKKIVEPNKQDILTAAKNYVIIRRIMAAENCQGFSMDCLSPITRHEIMPPCLAFSRLRDEGIVAACEGDWNAAISSRLTHLLFDRPGFMQDPAPNTVNNTLMGAHCTCATKLDGFDKPPASFILRSHSESNLGVAMQVLWRIGQKVTIMKFQDPGQIILGTGRVLKNINTPPSGGCRTSVEIEVDDIADCRDIKGFHQLFIYGDLELSLKAYCQLAGIKVVHI